MVLKHNEPCMSSSFAEELEIRGLRRFVVVIRFIRFFFLRQARFYKYNSFSSKVK